MGSLVRGKIEYSGISEYIPNDIKSFSQLNIDDMLYLDEASPDICDIIKIHINSDILNSRIVKTPIGKALDEKFLTGWKLLSECYFNLRLNYTLDEYNTSIYTINRNIPFTCGVSLDENSNFNSRYIPSIFVEDVYANIMDNRSILVNINLIFMAES